MKTAQELRAGNVFMVGKDPMVVLKAEYSKGTAPSPKPCTALTTSSKTSSSNANP